MEIYIIYKLEYNVSESSTSFTHFDMVRKIVIFIDISIPSRVNLTIHQHIRIGARTVGTGVVRSN